jgi:hypothetical protein
MFWTTIPHVALVTCLSLAGNNPSLWQSVAADYDARLTKQHPVFPDRPLTGRAAARSSKLPVLDLWRTAYASRAKRGDRYTAAWVWNRGPNKAWWIAKLATEYQSLEPLRRKVLGRRFGMNLWISGFLAVVLVFVPVFFGASVRYVAEQTTNFAVPFSSIRLGVHDA